MALRLLLPWREEKKMYSRWIEMELNRLNCVAAWPESPYQQATLRAIRDALRKLGVSSGPMLVPAGSKQFRIAA